MRDPSPLPDGFPRIPFSVQTARAVGISAERLRRRDLVAPFRGMRDSVAAADLIRRCHQYLVVAPADAVVSHSTAAELWMLPLPLRAPGDSESLHIAVPRGRRLIRARGIVGHEVHLVEEDVTELDGIPLTSPERTFCDLAVALDLEQLVAVGDRLLWRRRPLAARQTLEEAVERHLARRGRPTLLAALEMLSDRADSAPESMLRVRLSRAGLPLAHPNFEVRSAQGQFVAQVDLAFPAYRMAVEYEGDHHRSDVAQWRKDLRRVPRLEDVGWHVTRASASDLADSRPLIAHLRRRLRERGWRDAP